MNITKKVILEVDYNDLDRAVTAYLRSKGLIVKGTYESVAYEEWNNYASYDFKVCPDHKVRERDILDISAEKFNYNLDTILHLMAKDEVIPYGDYLVKVSW